MRAPDANDDLRALLADALRRIAVLEAAMLARRGRHDAADADLLTTIALATKGLSFTALSLHQRRVRDQALAEMLDSRLIDSPRQLGKALARLEGRDLAGWCLVRERSSRDGIVWRVTHTQTRALGE